MRLIIDMQGIQTESRFRGIGRYTMGLVQEMVRQQREHEVILLLSGHLSDSIEAIKADFCDLLPMNSIKVFQVLGPVMGHDRANDARRKAAEIMYEAVLHSMNPDVVLISSLVEHDVVTSVGKLNLEVPFAAVLYDLIPLIHSKIYLQDTNVRNWYFDKIDQLRRINCLLSISMSSRQEALDFLSFKEDEVINISTAADQHYKPLLINDLHRQKLKQKYGISGEYIMYAGDIDWRKDIEGLIVSYGSLSDSSIAKYSLVLIGRSLQRSKQEFVAIAERNGLYKDKLIFTGYVSEDDLVLLYNACTLFVFPSWHEGFGLPVLEAMSCGKAVIAANSSSLPEVVGRTDALFVPGDRISMTAKIAEVLDDVTFRRELEQHGLEQAKKFSWKLTARRAWEALESLHTQQPAQNRVLLQHLVRRPKLAFVTPLTHEKIGLTEYTDNLLPEMARNYEITVIVDQVSLSDTFMQANMPVHDAAWMRCHAHEFDRILYLIGNSGKHSYMFALMAEIPGVLVLIDFFLSSALVGCGEEQMDHWHILAKYMYQSHGWNTVMDWFKSESLSHCVVKWPCNLPVLQQALGVIAHSEFSRKLVRKFYGEQNASNWAIVPRLQQQIKYENKPSARESLGLSPDEFVVCCIGTVDKFKLNHRLLNAWLASPLATESKCRLVFIGKITELEYQELLTQTVAGSAAQHHVSIINLVNSDDYHNWLASADISVQLQALSQGDSAQIVFDCMASGLPVIVNAHGDMAELPDDAVWLLPDNFNDEHLTEALTNLWQDDARRAELGSRARALIGSQHNPRSCAANYAEAIEVLYNQAEKGLYGLIQTLPQLSPPLLYSGYPFLANILAANFEPSPRKHQLLVDVSIIAGIDLNSGIQRVTKSILQNLLKILPDDWQLEPVLISDDKIGYRYARHFMCNFLHIPDEWVQDAPVQVYPGDVFLGLDLVHHIYVADKVLQSWRQRGVVVKFLVYDLLPVTMRELFPEEAYQLHQRWLQVISLFDGVVCISRAVADEFYMWMQTFGAKRERPFVIDWFHLGANMDASSPTAGMPDNAALVLSALRNRISFLMVGTVEPRKGYLQVLSAFDILWMQGEEVNLVIVGNAGWKTHLDSQRRDIPQTVHRLRNHPKFGKQLFWLEGISDEYLEKVYSVSSCLIAASYGEGFGLPLIEAARHRLPLLVRDIPVFREVTDNKALFFTDSREPDAISNAVCEWLLLYQAGRHHRSDSIPYLTWEESTRIVIDSVLSNSPAYRSWMYDGVHRYWGADPRFHSQVGKIQGRQISTTGKQGFLIYGNYLYFEAGLYRIILEGTAKFIANNEWLDIVCDSGESKLFHFNFPEHTSKHWCEDLTFTLEDCCTDLELRVLVSEQTVMSVDSVTIKNLAKPKIGIVVVTYGVVPDILVNSLNSNYVCQWYVHHHGSEALVDDIKLLFSNKVSTLHFHCTNRGLSRSWNDGIIESKNDGNDITLIINDDVEFIGSGFNDWIGFILDHREHGLLFLTGEEPQDDGSLIIRQQDFACFSFGPLAMELVGAFDENFVPAYYEDVDYRIRSQLAGISMITDERVHCRHKRSSTMKNNSEISESFAIFSKTNRDYIIKKWGTDSDMLGSKKYTYPFDDSENSIFLHFVSDARP